MKCEVNTPNITYDIQSTKFIYKPAKFDENPFNATWKNPTSLRPTIKKLGYWFWNNTHKVNTVQ